MIRQLTLTNLYPSAERPRHGIFVEQRLRRLTETGQVSTHIVVPCARAPRACAPEEGRSEQRHGMQIRYTGFPVIRGLTTVFHPRLMFRGARHAVRAWMNEGARFDLVDGQFLYPDGVAAAHMARWLGLPLVLTARGSDVNLAMDERIAGRSIHWAIDRARAVIAVSSALGSAMIDRGVPPEKVFVIRNGVDLAMFSPVNKSEARSKTGLAGQVLLSVGNLVPEKGHDLTIAALARMPDATLVLIGAGPEQGRLEKLASTLGVVGRIRFVGPVAQSELALWYSAADLTVLASTREGMPNVLLESLACGTPVVASRVGGTPEVVAGDVAGCLFDERNPDALAAACTDVLARGAGAAAVRQYAESLGWGPPVQSQLALLQRIAGHA
jgi:teichuronic acid biosynthesis glycosyltransferase TuaC